MSSFIHTASHFNSIEKSIINEFKKENFVLPYSFWGEISPATAVKKISANIEELKKINVLAVTLQYAHHYGSNLNNEIAEQIEIISDKSGAKLLPIVSIVKALKSVNYQIEIEHITEIRELTNEEQNALNFLEMAINSLSVFFVTRTLEYDDAEGWCI